ncbi:magnesium transporter [Synechococcus elongatus]|uniref:Magnesium transporter MgtE n=1 Tax=Synechococcus elongatus PCC 11802 TaxID=2283154 RepID=A0AAT9JT31_SYNEL|nr:magnesium transporter [Synechococcus elongatus]QFZ92110.1 magnesium transporter [Synechococcus elongatus PCC 11802]
MVDSSRDQSQGTIASQELRDIVRQQLQGLLEINDYQGAKVLLQPVQYPDIAEAIEGLPETLQALAFRLLPKDEAIEVYEYLDSSVQQALIDELRSQDVLDLVEQMSPDDRVRLFDELPAKIVRRLLQQLSPAEREITSLLLGYGTGTAGRLMTPEYIALKEGMTGDQALARVRLMAPRTETIYTLYVTDVSRRLTGILSLRELLVASSEASIGELMTRDVISVHTDTDQEEVARVIQRYDLLAVPVVDREERLVGIVTVDDVIDILEEEATEDIYTLGGVQSGEDDYFQTNLLTVARRRVVWLFVLLITNTGTSAVISSQEEVLSKVVALAAFIPLLIGTGGNVGAQSSTVVIRGLNTDRLRSMNPLTIVSRELIAGALLGIMLAIVVTVWAFLLEGNWQVAIAVGFSLFVISVLASTAGSVLPLIFKRFGLDPALMSAPFITTVVDVAGVFVYLQLARVILGLN